VSLEHKIALDQAGLKGWISCWLKSTSLFWLYFNASCKLLIKRQNSIYLLKLSLILILPN